MVKVIRCIYREKVLRVLADDEFNGYMITGPVIICNDTLDWYYCGGTGIFFKFADWRIRPIIMILRW